MNMRTIIQRAAPECWEALRIRCGCEVNEKSRIAIEIEKRNSDELSMVIRTLTKLNEYGLAFSDEEGRVWWVPISAVATIQVY